MAPEFPRRTSVNEEILGRLAAYQAYAREQRRQLTGVLDDAGGDGRGDDSTGSVTATVGARGEFVSAVVAADRERRLDGNRLVEAIAEAVAVAERSRATAAADVVIDSGALARLRTMRPDDPEFRAAAAPGALPIPSAAGRSLTHLVADMLDLSRDGEPAAPAVVEIVGESGEADGWVAVVLAPDGAFVRCVVGGHWASGRSGSAISWVLSEAAVAAIDRLVEMKLAVHQEIPAADRIVADALGYLSSRVSPQYSAPNWGRCWRSRRPSRTTPPGRAGNGRSRGPTRSTTRHASTGQRNGR